MYFVYLLKSKKDNKYYIGQTNNINRRLSEHNSRREKSTKHRAPFELIGYEVYKTRNKARWREYQLKKSAHKRREFISRFVD